MVVNRNIESSARLDISALTTLFVLLCCTTIVAAAPDVLIWDAEWLEQAHERAGNNDPALAPAVKELRRNADRAMKAGPFSVMHKKQTPPSGDKHDYMSLGPYWWPNPDSHDGLPYVRRDGQVFPGIRKISDRTELGRMTRSVETLALAYYFIGDEAYAERAALLIRAWFLDPATSMHPHLRYGQAIRGINDGRGIGIIETRSFANLLDAATLLADAPAWTERDQQALVKWFDAYLEWLTESELGRDERAAENNHGTYYDLQAVAYAHFIGKDERAIDVLRDVGPRRIAVQIELDGSQPLELERTNAWGYSIGNLTGLMTLAGMADQYDIDLWNFQTPDGRCIRQAISFLMPFGLEDRPWPYQQISGWSADPLYPLLREAATRFPDSIDWHTDIPDAKSSSRDRLLYSSTFTLPYKSN